MSGRKLDISEMLSWEDGLPHPRWDLIEGWIRSLPETSDSTIGWAAVTRGWLDEFAEALNRRYRTSETDHFQVLALHAGGDGDRLARLAESARGSILRRLPGVANFASPGKQVVLAFHDAEDYYRYVSVYFPEGRHGGSSGVHIREGQPHVALHGKIIDLMENTLAHELTHAGLHHLGLPIWVEEGLAQTIEHDVTGRSYLHLDSKTGERHKRYWSHHGLDDFWSGAGFGRPGKVQGLCYQLAEILIRLLLEESRPRWFGWVQEPHRRFVSFLRTARALDCGESAYRECMGEEMSKLAERFLGPGSWAPSPDLPPNMEHPLASTH